MAYVSISNNLTHDVRGKIDQMKRAEYNAVQAPPQIMLTGNEDFLLNGIWGEHIHLRDVLPRAWCTTTKEFWLKVTHHSPMPEGGSVATEFTEILYTSTAILTPPKFSGSSSMIRVDSTASPELQAKAEYNMKLREIERRWNTTRSKVTEFLSACKSLNEGLKLWPDLRHYIPQQYLDRVEQKREKTKSEGSAAMEKLKDMNTDELVANVVMARLAEAA